MSFYSLLTGHHFSADWVQSDFPSNRVRQAAHPVMEHKNLIKLLCVWHIYLHVRVQCPVPTRMTSRSPCLRSHFILRNLAVFHFYSRGRNVGRDGRKPWWYESKSGALSSQHLRSSALFYLNLISAIPLLFSCTLCPLLGVPVSISGFEGVCFWSFGLPGSSLVKPIKSIFSWIKFPPKNK